jgi:branched-chain amino acid transport system permease protein
MLFLLQDGITNGAIYALLGLALVLVFAVTRVILIPQGEFVTFGALSYAMLATGQVPGTGPVDARTERLRQQVRQFIDDE